MKMIKAWRKWRKTTNLSDGTFLKFYLWSQIIIKPKRKARKLKKRLTNRLGK